MSADIGSGSAFQAVTPHSATLPRQAVAASWAAFCSRALGQDQVEVEFTSLHVFLTIKYGLDSTDSSTWQREHPCKPEDSMLAIGVKRLLDQKAPEHFPKPGGWCDFSWLMDSMEDVQVAAKGSNAEREHLQLNKKVENYKGLQDHQEWSALLKPVLARYTGSACESTRRVASTECGSAILG